MSDLFSVKLGTTPKEILETINNNFSEVEIRKADANSVIPISQKGNANGVASLNESGLVPSSQLPSYVDDVIELKALGENPPPYPLTGEKYYHTNEKVIYTYGTSSWDNGILPEKDKIYVNTNTDSIYRWGGSNMIEINQPLSNLSVLEGLTQQDLGGSPRLHYKGNPLLSMPIDENLYKDIVSLKITQSPPVGNIEASLAYCETDKSFYMQHPTGGTWFKVELDLAQGMVTPEYATYLYTKPELVFFNVDTKAFLRREIQESFDEDLNETVISISFHEILQSSGTTQAEKITFSDLDIAWSALLADGTYSLSLAITQGKYPLGVYRLNSENGLFEAVETSIYINSDGTSLSISSFDKFTGFVVMI